jgi:hypothetical protein
MIKFLFRIFGRGSEVVATSRSIRGSWSYGQRDFSRDWFR